MTLFVSTDNATELRVFLNMNRLLNLESLKKRENNAVDTVAKVKRGMNKLISSQKPGILNHL